jgi:hypothetical protein
MKQLVKDQKMIDSTPRKSIRVLAESVSGPYARVSVDQLDRVRILLRANEISHWVDHLAISVDGQPAFVVVEGDAEASHVEVLEQQIGVGMSE